MSRLSRLSRLSRQVPCISLSENTVEAPRFAHSALSCSAAQVPVSLVREKVVEASGSRGIFAQTAKSKAEAQIWQAVSGWHWKELGMLGYMSTNNFSQASLFKLIAN